MATLQKEEEDNMEKLSHSYHVKIQDDYKQIPLVMVVTKNRRVPNVLIYGG